MHDLDPNSPLTDIYHGYNKARGEEISTDSFADELAQVICHAALMAKLNAGRRDIKITTDNLKEYIRSNFHLVRHICKDAMDELEHQEVGHVTELLDVINLVEPKELMKDPASEEGMYIHFYEDFLAEYNPDMKKKMGVYYTPKYIVEFIVKAIDDTLSKRFGKSQGLADENVMSLDFSTGTGAFLTEMVRTALSKKNSVMEKRQLKNHILRNMFGFEAMMPPYIIAQIRLHSLMAHHRIKLKNHKSDQAGIVLTNTLTVNCDSLANPANNALHAMRSEIERAEEIKKDAGIMVISGNPPYKKDSENKGAKYTTIEKLLRSYHEIDGEEVTEGNCKKHLNNDYVKFIRWAQQKVDDNKSGIVGIITCNGFLDNNFNAMRKSLLDSFETIYVINLHGDTNSIEKPPEGRTNGNVFPIQTGVCIVLFIKGGKEESRGIFYKDMWGPNDLRKKELSGANLESMKWEKLEPYEPSYFLTREVASREESDAYNKFPDVGSIFDKSLSGVNSGGRDTFAYHLTAKRRDEVLQKLKSGDIEGLQIKNSAQNQAKRLHVFYRHRKIKDEFKKKIIFRPFDERFTYMDGDSSKGVVQGQRSEIRKHIERKDNITLVTVKKSRDSFFGHALITDKPVTIAALSSAASHMFPLYIYDNYGYKRENLCSNVRKYFNRLYGNNISVEEIMGYVYAVLYSPTYRLKYEKSLCDGIDLPRIPFPTNVKELKSLAEIGNDLARIHVTRDVNIDGIEVDGEDDLVVGNDFRWEGGKIYINKHTYISSVSQEVFHCKIGSYEVIPAFLRARKGCNIESEIPYLKSVIGAMRDTLALMERIDGEFNSITSFDDSFYAAKTPRPLMPNS